MRTRLGILTVISHRTAAHGDRALSLGGRPVPRRLQRLRHRDPWQLQAGPQPQRHRLRQVEADGRRLPPLVHRRSPGPASQRPFRCPPGARCSGRFTTMSRYACSWRTSSRTPTTTRRRSARCSPRTVVREPSCGVSSAVGCAPPARRSAATRAPRGARLDGSSVCDGPRHRARAARADPGRRGRRHRQVHRIPAHMAFPQGSRRLEDRRLQPARAGVADPGDPLTRAR